MQMPRVDEREIALSADQAATDGNLRLTPLAVECGITYLIGTHAEVDFKGQLCRFRLAIQDVDNTFHHFDATIQRLVDTTGQTIAPDTAAMGVKRQELNPVIGAADTLVMDLYFNLTPERTPKAVTLRGDNEPSGIGVTVTAPHHPSGIVVPIPAKALYPPKPLF
jgi:hypothetical protein